MTFQEIPGTTSPEQLDIVSRLSYSVPNDGWIVEVGCYCGRQSIVLGRSKHKSVLLTCIDIFPESGTDYIFRDWKNTTEYIANIEPVRMTSPPAIIFNMNYSVTKPIDLLVIDLNDVYINLLFWSAFVGINSKIAIHTYNDSVLQQEVVKFARNHTNFNHIDESCTSVLERVS